MPTLHVDEWGLPRRKACKGSQVHEGEVRAVRVDPEAILEEIRGGFGGVEEDDGSPENTKAHDVTYSMSDGTA